MPLECSFSVFCLISLPRPNVFSKGNQEQVFRCCFPALVGLLLTVLWERWCTQWLSSCFPATYSPFSGASWESVMWWDQIHQWRSDYKEGSGCSFSGINVSSLLAISLSIKVWLLWVEGCCAVNHAGESLGARDLLTAYLEDTAWNAAALNPGWFLTEIRRLPACNAQLSESSWDAAFLVEFLWSSLWAC